MSDQGHCQATSSNHEPVRHASKNNSNSDILCGPDPTPGKERPSSGEPIVVAGDPDSPLRIFVRCLSHKIPGRPSERTAAIANIVCRYHLQRDMDADRDQISCRGLPELDGTKVKFLLECGTGSPLARVEDIPIMGFKWDGTKLAPRDVDTRTRAYLYKLPFKRKPPLRKARSPKTMAQMRAGMDDEAWDRFMEEVMLRKLQYKKKASTVDRSWAKERPGLFYDVVQGYVAQQRYHKLELPPSLRQWEQAQKDRENVSTFAHLIDAVVLDNMGVETHGEPPALPSTTTRNEA